MIGERSRLCAVFREMVRKGINPENGTLSVVLDAFSKEGNLLDAFKLFIGMLEKGTPLSVSACESLIDALCLDGKYGKALEFLLEMGEKGFVLNHSTCSAIGRSFSLKGDTDTDEVCLVIKAMTTFGWISDSTTFSDLLKDSKVGFLLPDQKIGSSGELAARNQNAASSEDVKYVLKQVGFGCAS
ncbi:hypothetical protein FXO38_09635 [Capsicum annuum]|nr:hypothetical protein FXO38_09635 [Capsicum annuum]KAF3668008.1 hypothetical protein FXO37_09740 [Capsicum annuum]